MASLPPHLLRPIYTGATKGYIWEGLWVTQLNFVKSNITKIILLKNHPHVLLLVITLVTDLSSKYDWTFPNSV